MQGGGWNNNAQNCRSANRNRNNPRNRNNHNGFRVASSSRRQNGGVQGCLCRAAVMTRPLSRSGQRSDEESWPGGASSLPSNVPPQLMLDTHRHFESRGARPMRTGATSSPETRDFLSMSSHSSRGASSGQVLMARGSIPTILMAFRGALTWETGLSHLPAY